MRCGSGTIRRCRRCSRDCGTHGLRLVVASNWDASLEAVLERAGVLEFVDGAVNSASVGAAKPDPRLIASALALAGVAPSAALHVGDSLREDVGAALGAGVRPVLLVRDGPVAERQHAERRSALPELETIRSLEGLVGLLGL